MSCGSLVGVDWGVGVALSIFSGRTHPSEERLRRDAFTRVKVLGVGEEKEACL